MYLPPAFKVDDQQRAFALIDAEPFATVISQTSNGPFVNHLPLLLDRGRAAGPRLVGHMARRNPQWQHFKIDKAVLVVFHGPHTYITPTWYAEHDVPTWNYAVAHVRGEVRLLEGFKDLIEILGKMTAKFEDSSPKPWRFSLPDDLKTEEQLTGAIVGFEIVNFEVEAKFKLSQNRSARDQAAVIDGLATRSDDQSRQVRDLMRG